MFSGTSLTWNPQRTASYCIASQSEVWGCPLRHCPGPRVIDVNTVVGAVDIIGDRHALSISPWYCQYCPYCPYCWNGQYYPFSILAQYALTGDHHQVSSYQGQNKCDGASGFFSAFCIFDLHKKIQYFTFFTFSGVQFLPVLFTLCIFRFVGLWWMEMPSV